MNAPHESVDKKLEECGPKLCKLQTDLHVCYIYMEF